MSAGTIAVVKPGHLMDAKYREKFLEGAQSISTAFVKDGQIGPMFMHCSEFQLLPSLTDSEKDFKDRTYIVRSETESVVDEEKQPFEIVVDADGKPAVVAFTEGTFEKFATDDAEFSPETMFIQNFFADKCQKLYEDCDEDLTKFFEVIDSPGFRKEIQDQMGTRGVITLLGKNNTLMSISKSNGLFAEYAWGHTSDNLGILEPRPITGTGSQPPVKEGKKLTYAERKAAAKSSVGNTTINKPAETKPVTVPAIPPKEDDDSDIQIDERQGTIKEIAGKEYLFPPTTLTGRHLRKFYTKHRKGDNGAQGHIGMDWKSRPGIPSSQVAQHSHFYSKLKVNASKPTTKNTEPAKVGKEAQVVGHPIPVMSPGQVEATVKVIKDGEALLSSEQLKAHENEYPSWCQRCNTKLDEGNTPLLWRYEKLLKLDHASLAQLANDMRFRILSDNPHIIKAVATAAKPEEKKTLSYAERKAAAKKVA